eukprot:scaffold21634_cov63-Phaeocystis_antarctica.AAC.5
MIHVRRGPDGLGIDPLVSRRGDAPDADEDAGVDADARRTGGGRGDNQVTWGEDARHTGGSTASPGPVRLRLSQLSWLSSSLSSLSSALSDADQGDARRSHRVETDEGGAQQARRARRAGAGAWLCCCCGGGSADARDEVGGADNHEALLRDGQRKEPLVEAPGAARRARPVPAVPPAARMHDAPELTVADELTSASTLTASAEAIGTAATPCVHTVWGLRCPYKGQSCPWPGRTGCNSLIVDETRRDLQKVGMRPLDARLFEAVWAGDLAAAQAAVADGASARAQDGDGGTPLHNACDKGHLDIAQWLHSLGASLDATDSDGETPLHNACSWGHLDVAQWLHSAGASVEAIDSEGRTPLHEACYQGRLEIA